jgi:Zn-dependent protease
VMNLLMAAVGAVVLGLVLQAYGDVQKPSGTVKFITENLLNFLSINVFLALFNLLPIPPFDGSHILEGMLPRGLAGAYAKFRQMGMLLVIVLLVVVPQMVPGFNLVGQFVGPPMRWMMQHYLALATWAAGI